MSVYPSLWLPGAFISTIGSNCFKRLQNTTIYFLFIHYTITYFFSLMVTLLEGRSITFQYRLNLLRSFIYWSLVLFFPLQIKWRRASSFWSPLWRPFLRVASHLAPPPTMSAQSTCCAKSECKIKWLIKLHKMRVFAAECFGLLLRITRMWIE